ncbi:sensor histidine kinase [Roseateles sp. NT4]|uniref:sensor histidine kinase n=1 Tax=Roseateles sp. NT4 TaxID=3453715 RepID=UPI003EEDB296
MASSHPPNRLLAHVVGTAAICVVVGFLLFLMRGRNLGTHMLYSFTIGSQISLYISLLQYGAAEVLRRRGAGDEKLQQGWVGWRWMIPCTLLGAFAGYCGGLWLGDLITGQHSSQPWDGDLGGSATTLAFTLLIAALGTLFFVSYFSLQALKLGEAQALQQAAEARLTLLQSQLEPHMLFNTLAHLRVLIKLRPDEAQRMLDRLIDYLRATLQASRATEHALADEFERLSDYLALMQLRMGERLRVKLELPAELGSIAIPPLLLQPLVENAIKHGLEPHVDGGELRVTAARQQARLILEVADSGAGLTHATGLPGTGFGLSQVRERLAQRYGNAASFELKPQPGGGSVARIEIPS